MITRLEGKLEEIAGLTCTVQPAGAAIAYEVMVPGYLAQELHASIGRTIRLHTLEYLEAQGQGTSFIPRLIGFGSASERRFFELFTTVKGLGSKRALRALALPPAQIAGIIAARDTAALKRLPEIGPRLAETVVAELHGKVNPFVDPAAHVEAKPPASSPALGDAVSALVALGEKREEAERLAIEAVRSLSANATPDAILAHVFARLGR